MSDHYAEAERLLAIAEDSQREDLGHVLAWAQVHATLAATVRAELATPEPPAALSIPWPPDDATVGEVAQELNRCLFVSPSEKVAHWDDLTPSLRHGYLRAARAVLAALGGDR